jgi:hypothetical protein
LLEIHHKSPFRKPFRLFGRVQLQKIVGTPTACISGKLGSRWIKARLYMDLAAKSIRRVHKQALRATLIDVGW